MKTFKIDLETNTKLVYVNAPYTPKYLTDNNPHNKTIKTGESCYLLYLSAECMKCGVHSFLILKKRKNNYFVFDFMDATVENLNLFKVDKLAGITTKSDYEKIINQILQDYNEWDILEFNRKYIK